MRTEEFTVVGADRPPLRFATIFCPRFETTGELSGFSSLVSIGAVGIHGKHLARSEPTRTASAGGQLRALNRLRAEALRASCHVALGRPPTGSSELLPRTVKIRCSGGFR